MHEMIHFTSNITRYPNPNVYFQPERHQIITQAVILYALQLLFTSSYIQWGEIQHIHYTKSYALSVDVTILNRFVVDLN